MVPSGIVFADTISSVCVIACSALEAEGRVEEKTLRSSYISKIGFTGRGTQLSLRLCHTVKQTVLAVAQLVPGWRKDAAEDGVDLVELAVKVERARNCGGI